MGRGDRLSQTGALEAVRYPLRQSEGEVSDRLGSADGAGERIRLASEDHAAVHEAVAAGWLCDELGDVDGLATGDVTFDRLPADASAAARLLAWHRHLDAVGSARVVYRGRHGKRDVQVIPSGHPARVQRDRRVQPARDLRDEHGRTGDGPRARRRSAGLASGPRLAEAVTKTE